MAHGREVKTSDQGPRHPLPSVQSIPGHALADNPTCFPGQHLLPNAELMSGPAGLLGGGRMLGKAGVCTLLPQCGRSRRWRSQPRAENSGEEEASPCGVQKVGRCCGGQSLWGGGWGRGAAPRWKPGFKIKERKSFSVPSRSPELHFCTWPCTPCPWAAGGCSPWWG